MMRIATMPRANLSLSLSRCLRETVGRDSRYQFASFLRDLCQVECRNFIVGTKIRDQVVQSASSIMLGWKGKHCTPRCLPLRYYNEVRNVRFRTMLLSFGGN